MTRPVATTANKAAAPWRAVGVAVDIVDPEGGGIEGLESIIPQQFPLRLEPFEKYRV